MSKTTMDACKMIHVNLMPRLQFLWKSFAAMAEVERDDDEQDGTSLYDGAVIALDDIIGVASELTSMLEKNAFGK